MHDIFCRTLVGPIRTIFRGRSVRLGLLAFYALWFLVVVPGHTRGQVSLLSKNATAHTCCATDNDESSREPSPDARRTCAVCYFTLGLAIPPVIAFDLDPAGEVAQLAILWSEQVRSSKKFDPFHSRGPPAPLA